MMELKAGAFADALRLVREKNPLVHCITNGVALNDCAKLENIVIPEGVQEIERFAFNKCVSLTHVEIPASLTTIRRQAFQECQSLSSFTWTGTGPTKVTDDIFFACPLHGKRIPGMPNL